MTPTYWFLSILTTPWLKSVLIFVTGPSKIKCALIKLKKELVFYRPHTTKFDMPCALDAVVQERVAKLLGVFFSDKLGFEDHVNFVLTVCSQRMHIRNKTVKKAQAYHPSSCRQYLIKMYIYIYCPDTLTHYICYLSLHSVCVSVSVSYSTSLMLSLLPTGTFESFDVSSVFVNSWFSPRSYQFFVGNSLRRRLPS